MASFDGTVSSQRSSIWETRSPFHRLHWALSLGAINKDGSFHYAKAFGEESADPTDTDALDAP
ncbi:hypothetical protein N7467_005602 [Penicillium canescens]|nr:hypothetical protein N7467_005602 [Penicillium canescens]